MAKLEGAKAEVASTSQDILECLNDILDKVSSTDDSQNSGDYFDKDDFYIIDRNAFRTNTDAESVIGERVICSDSDDDSEEEFNNILEKCRRMMQKNGLNEEDEDEPSFIYSSKAKIIEHEYDNLPAIEKLSIHADERITLRKLGKITQVVDCLVVVQCESNVALDVDSVIFDENRNAIGQVFDIFGAVVSPLYSIRFNSSEEAQQHPVGKSVFFAPDAEQFTHSVFTDQLKNLKITDSCWDGDGDCPDDQLAFSDDESERRYLAKKRQNKKNRSCRQDGPTGEPFKKRGGFGRGGYVPQPATTGSRGGNWGPKRGRFSSKISPRAFENNLNFEDAMAQSSGLSNAWSPSPSGQNRMPGRRPYFHRDIGRESETMSFSNRGGPIDMRFSRSKYVFGQRPNFEHTWTNSRTPSSQFTSPTLAGPPNPSSFATSDWVSSQSSEAPASNEEQPVFVDTRLMQD